MVEEKDLYAVLGVERQASLDEIRKTYRKLARKFHPDVNPGNDAAEERFKAISEAHDILGDEEKRKLYDEFGIAGVQSGFDAESARAARSWQRQAQGQGAAQGFGGYQSFEDIFGDIFGAGGARAGAGARRPAAGEDFESEIEIDLLDAIRGLSTEVSLQRREACSACAGAGVDLGSASSCPACAGSGQAQVGDGPVTFMRTCPQCRGAGRVGSSCGQCGGRGHVDNTQRLAVKIPAGVDNGSRVRVAGKGGSGVSGGAAGDLYIRVRVRPHAKIERRGDDLYVDLPVTVAEAVSGASIEVPTPDGARVRVRVPAATQSGVLLRVRGHGMPHLKGGGRGDLYLRVAIRIPESGGDDVARGAALLDGGYAGDLRSEMGY